MDRDTRWRLSARDAYARREWDGESIVYDERNGATHLLGTGATLLLRTLQDLPGPVTTEALVWAAFSSDPVLDNDERKRAEETIFELERLGLIESGPP